MIFITKELPNYFSFILFEQQPVFDTEFIMETHLDKLHPQYFLLPSQKYSEVLYNNFWVLNAVTWLVQKLRPRTKSG